MLAQHLLPGASGLGRAMFARSFGVIAAIRKDKVVNGRFQTVRSLASCEAPQLRDAYFNFKKLSAEALFGAQVLKVSSNPTITASLFQELVVESAAATAGGPVDAPSQQTLAVLKALNVSKSMPTLTIILCILCAEYSNSLRRWCQSVRM